MISAVTVVIEDDITQEEKVVLAVLQRRAEAGKAAGCGQTGGSKS